MVNLVQSGLLQLRGYIPFNSTKDVVINDGKNRTSMRNAHVRRHIGYTDMSRPEIQNSLLITKELLKRMADRSHQSGAEFIVLVIPSKEYMFYWYSRKTGQSLPDLYQKAAENESKLGANIVTWLNAQGIPVIEAKYEIENTLMGEGGSYPPGYDGHPVALGYKAYAEAIYKEYFKKRQP